MQGNIRSVTPFDILRTVNVSIYSETAAFGCLRGIFAGDFLFSSHVLDHRNGITKIGKFLRFYHRNTCSAAFIKSIFRHVSY